MPTTVNEIIEAGLRLQNVIDEEETPSAEQGVKTLHILNDMMADMKEDGIDLGWYPIADADISVDAPLQRRDVRAVKLCLAMELAPHFGIEPLPVLKERHEEAYAKLAKRAIKRTEADVSGLPMGEAQPWASDIEHG